MPRPQLLPDINKLVEWRDRGMSQTEIRDKINEESKKIMGSTYQPVSRSAVSVAFHRAGETGDGKPRYDEEIPWSPIAKRWINDYRQAQLRTWARINRGDSEQLTGRAQSEFKSFVNNLERSDAVIHYTDEDGFFAVKKRPGIDTGLIRLTDKQIKERGLEQELEKYLQFRQMK